MRQVGKGRGPVLGESIRVLVVSKYDVVLELYAALLTGYHVETATDAETAAATLSRASYDLIVTDTVGCTHELVPPLLEAGTPVLIVCDGACTGQHAPACGIDADGVTCLHWPHSLEIFRSAVRDLLGGQSPRYHWRPSHPPDLRPDLQTAPHVPL